MLNKVMLVGNLGKDPEVRYLENGTAVANFSLATSESYKDKTSGERKTVTEWHNIVVWRGLAEVAEKYLKKGSMVFVKGKIRTRSWDDKDGNKRYTTEIVADNFRMLDKKREGSGPAEFSSAEPGTSVAEPESSDAAGDDLPF